MNKTLFTEKNLKSYFVGWAAQLVDPKRTFEEDKVKRAVRVGHEMYNNLKELGVLKVSE